MKPTEENSLQEGWWEANITNIMVLMDIMDIGFWMLNDFRIPKKWRQGTRSHRDKQIEKIICFLFDNTNGCWMFENAVFLTN